MPTVRPLVLLGAAALLATAATAPAVAGGHGDGGSGHGDRDEVRRSGHCSGSAYWEIKAKADDGRVELELEVDGDRTGRAWRWSMRHNGSVSARGTAVTRGHSGSFEVERRLTDLSGTDRFEVRARSTASGEACRGSIDW